MLDHGDFGLKSAMATSATAPGFALLCTVTVHATAAVPLGDSVLHLEAPHNDMHVLLGPDPWSALKYM